MKMTSIRLRLLLVFAVVVCPGALLAQLAYYVSPTGDNANAGTIGSPFKTIEKARDVIRTHPNKATSDFIVYLRGGSYFVSSKITFSQSDGGVGNRTVSYQAYAGETPILTGGTPVIGWTQVPGKPYWQAPVTYTGFRQIYVNAKRRYRASSKLITATDWIATSAAPTTATGYIVKSGDAAVYQNPTDVEIHQQIDWQDTYFPVTGISEANGRVSLTAPAMSSMWYTGLSPLMPFTIENALELLDSPGEWYCNKTTNTLYYYPEANENLATATVTIPVTERFLEIIGTKNSKVTNLSFAGITFEYAGWAAPNRAGWFGIQSTLVFQPSSAPGGQTYSHVYVEHARNVAFSGCEFRHLGAVALDFRNGVYYGGVAGSKFHDVGDAGVAVSTSAHDSLSGNEDSCNYISIRNNLFYRTGQDFRGAVAIQAYYVKGIVIEHNQILNVPYTGISVGWGWSGKPRSQTSRQNTIRYNRIGLFNSAGRDGGGIYTLGQQPGSVCSHNYIYDQHGEWGALYFDEGTSGYVSENNLVLNCYLWLYIHKPSTNNVVVNNNYTDTPGLINRGTNITLTNTTAVRRLPCQP